MKNKIEKIFFVTEIKPSGNVANKLPLLRRKYLSSEGKGLKTVLRFCISFRETFFNSNCLHRDQ